MPTPRFLAVAALAPAFAAGCAETCPLPQASLNDEVFDVFGRVIALEQEPAPEWPSESLPFNGPREWTVNWASDQAESPVTVVIDGQTFEEGRGYFDDVECGNFSIAFKGTYVAEDGAEHLVAANARLVVWPDGMDGFVDFQSSWSTPEGDVIGTANGTAQLSTTAASVATGPG